MKLDVDFKRAHAETEYTNIEFDNFTEFKNFFEKYLEAEDGQIKIDIRMCKRE